MEKLEEIQWSVVRQEDATETEGKGVQNCGQTSSVEMDVRSDKDGYYPK